MRWPRSSKMRPASTDDEASRLWRPRLREASWFCTAREHVLRNDRLVLASVALAPMHDLAQIGAVLQKVGQWSDREGNAAPRGATRERPLLRPDAPRSEIADQGRQALELEIAPEDEADGLRFSLVDDELAILNPVAERQRAAHPQPLLLRCRDLVP